jgi:hypothetical protein
MEEEGTDTACIQEPNTIGDKIGGMQHFLTVLTFWERKKRAAIIINNKNIDTLLITQISDEDLTVMETNAGNARFVIASIYFDIERPIEVDLNKTHAIITYAKDTGIISAIDSNARSTTWHDSLANKRGKVMEEFIISMHLHIGKEESQYTNLSRGEPYRLDGH